jgi:hypothetical protein
VGASGAICGMLGAIIAEGVKNWDCLNFPVFQLTTWGLQLGIFLALVCFVCQFIGLYSAVE